MPELVALCNSRVWVLDRQVFQQVMMRTGIQKIEENVRFLKSVPLMQKLSWDLLAKIADVLEVVITIFSHNCALRSRNNNNNNS